MALAVAFAVAINMLFLPSTGAKWGCAANAAMKQCADKWRGRLSYVWWIMRGLRPRLWDLFEKSRVIELHGKALSTDKHSGDGLA